MHCTVFVLCIFLILSGSEKLPNRNSGLDLLSVYFDSVSVETLTGDDIVSGDEFGTGLGCLNRGGRTFAFVGAPKHNGNRGAVYVYEKTGFHSYTQVDKFAPDDVEAGDKFGNSISTHGTSIAVGAHGHNERGAVYVFDFSNYELQLETKLISNIYLDDFGKIVAFYGSGNLLVSAPSAVNEGQGKVFLYSKGGGNEWEEIGFLAPPNDGASHLFGDGVSVSESLLMIGAPNGIGLAFLYDLIQDNNQQDAWLFREVIAPENGVDGDEFGVSGLFFEDFLLVGAQRTNSGATEKAGSIYVFHHDASLDEFVEIDELFATTPAAYGAYGITLALVDDILIIGRQHSSHGEIDVFYISEVSDGNSQSLSLDAIATIESPGERGFSVFMTVCRPLVLIGAPQGDTVYAYLSRLNVPTPTLAPTPSITSMPTPAMTDEPTSEPTEEDDENTEDASESAAWRFRPAEIMIILISLMLFV